ncbi:MAG: His-Xaa-Ser system radical SAM maturase HxsC [Nitrospira defluvii]|nr:His-Xaa-Ser system radical SAM maturase HxsC [Nitrospira defluvii]
MLKLQGQLPIVHASTRAPYLVMVTKNAQLPTHLKQVRALLMLPGLDPTGFKTVLAKGKEQSVGSLGSDVFEVSDDYEYLDEGDILRVDPASGSMRCLYRRNSLHNTILLTERCNHCCLMCSQPPKQADDSWLMDEAMELIGLIPPETEALGFSGGEPTLYGDRFIELLQYTKTRLSTTAIDVLSNGRAFRDLAFAKQYAAVQHPDLLIGIPIYCDDPVRHDYVVQSRGAFDDTIQGILNLKAVEQRVEIRIVIHRQTIDRLVHTCEFLARNLLFVDHVALMGLEITGFTRPNLDLLWIDPYDYKDVLSEAMAVLNAYGMAASVYNHQLCTVNPDVRGNYRKSISDWKNEYLDECAACTERDECGGLFSSSKLYKHSAHIKAFS